MVDLHNRLQLHLAPSVRQLVFRNVMLTRSFLNETLNGFSHDIELDIAGCRLKEGRPKYGQELKLELAKLRASAETFQWLGKVTPQRLVLKLKADETYMAFKYARYVRRSIEVCQEIASENDFEQKIVA